jgi:hypothetical protein
VAGDPTSKLFRDRAEECRTIADLVHVEKRRRLILKVAAEYERMADRAAAIELQQADETFL